MLQISLIPSTTTTHQNRIQQITTIQVNIIVFNYITRRYINHSHDGVILIKLSTA